MTQVLSNIRGAVIVTRVSTGEQVKNGTSLESQLETCRSKAASLGLPIIAEYEDAGISGGSLLLREGMQAALADIKAGRASMLICANMSRYSRDVEHQQRIRKDVRAAGGAVVFCDMQFEDTPEGDLAFSIMGGFAEYERKAIRARTMRGKRKRVEEGQQTSRSQPPFGYIIPTKADILRGTYPPEQLGKYVIIEENAKVVKRIFDEYGNRGLSLTTVARGLNHDGIRTPRNSEFWHATTLRNILVNSVYKGEPISGKWQTINDESRIGTSHRINGFTITRPNTQVRASEDNWIRLSAPAIVSIELWDRVAERRSGNKSRSGGNPTRVRMLSGIVYCPICGAKAIAHAAQQGKRKYAYYICRNYLTQWERSPEKACSGNVYTIETVEHAVCAAIAEACEAPTMIVAAIEAYRPSRVKADDSIGKKDIESLHLELQELDRTEQVTVQAQIEGMRAGASPSAYASVFSQIRERREEIEHLIRKSNNRKSASMQEKASSIRADKPEIAGSALSDVHTALTSAYVSDAEKRQLVTMLVDKVVCQKDGAEVCFLPTIQSDDTLQNVFTTSSNTVGDLSSLPCLSAGMWHKFESAVQ
jgi:site-specific DNA recombinase